MLRLTDRQIADYFHRSYKTVDGLWFMKVEGRYGFDTALDVDDDVWRVMPKIQARKLKEFAEATKGIDALLECFTTKLTLEGFEYTYERRAEGDGFEVTVTSCPWQELLVKANRQHLGEKIGTRICNTEYAAWASEFGDDIVFELRQQLCKGCETCVLRFKQRVAGR